MISASKVALARLCGYWRAHPAPERATSAEATEGTRVHELIERDDGESPTTEPGVLTARRYIASLGNRPMDREVAYGWDGRGSYVLGHGRSSYERMPDAILCGTADLVVCVAPGRWRVVDWKNGERGALSAGPQLRALAALAIAATGARECEMHAVYLGGDGSPVDHGTMVEMEADGELESVRALGPTDPQPGDHCTAMYCPLAGHCPAFTEAAELVPVGALTSRRNPLVSGVHTEEDALAALPLLDLVEERVKAVREELRAYVRAHGGALTLPDGRTYGPTRVSRRGGVDGDAALALAERMGASKDDLAACLKAGATYERWETKGKKAS